MLPVEDGGGDAVWGWSRALDLHRKRIRMDIKKKHEHMPIASPRGLDYLGCLTRGLILAETRTSFRGFADYTLVARRIDRVGEKSGQKCRIQR